MSKTHILKAWPKYFQAVTEVDAARRKTVEIRRNDRDFQVGDLLVLHEYDPENESYTGSMTTVLVTHIVDEPPFVTEGYVAMSIDWNYWQNGGTQ